MLIISTAGFKLATKTRITAGSLYEPASRIRKKTKKKDPAASNRCLPCCHCHWTRPTASSINNLWLAMQNFREGERVREIRWDLIEEWRVREMKAPGARARGTSGSGCGAGGHCNYAGHRGPEAAPLGRHSLIPGPVAMPYHAWLIKRAWQSGEDQCPWCSTTDQRW